MKITSKNKKKAINEVMDDFDFQKVHCLMNKLGQKWATKFPMDTPSVEELKETARGLLEGAVKGGVGSTHSTGRLVAHLSEYELSLEYIAVGGYYYG